MRKIPKSYYFFLRSTLKLITSTPFWTLSTVGNLTVFTFAGIFYYVEAEANPLVDEYMDCLWWAFATVTTVGYGDITPLTTLGRIVGISLMLIGTALFASYVAMFADAFMKAETDFRNSQKATKPESLANKVD
ncbi:MAG: potassium channel family protein [Zetaproteobacteria bacterium]|nr:potassium channel family protein [Zetaproteobacteria bacterium]